VTPVPSAFHSIRAHAVLLGVLAVALAVRVWFLRDGVPFAVGIDEPAIVDRALRILRTGDWNTHVFDYPPLVIYLHAVVAIARFLVGAVRGEWASLDQLQIASVYTTGRLVAAIIGAATVWITYRLGRDLGSSAVGLVAAAQLAVIPMHVRESHFILTDVPVTALTTLAVWLAVRASTSRNVQAYAAAGAVGGLGAAAKYNGIVALVSLAVVWFFRERGTAGGYRKAAFALVSAAGAFVLAAPYAILDLPAFLNGFAGQAARFANSQVPGGEPGWLIYVKHLSLAGRWWLPMAALGGAAALFRASSRTRWIPVIAFAGAYFYVLATHAPVFARYALPLVPIVCLLVARGVVEIGAVIARAAGRPRAARLATAALATALTASFAIQTVMWIGQLSRKDTRDLAAEWLVANLGPGTRLVVENNGPTYLNTAGFAVGAAELVLDNPADVWASKGYGYLVISSAAGLRDPSYGEAGPVVYEIAPTADRWGPPIRVVRLSSSGPAH
jgi:4-amino-4-deoxy-L-arabinose transferase-like glycosyltransferase